MSTLVCVYLCVNVFVCNRLCVFLMERERAEKSVIECVYERTCVCVCVFVCVCVCVLEYAVCVCCPLQIRPTLLECGCIVLYCSLRLSSEGWAGEHSSGS